MVKDGKAIGVRTINGEEITANIVVSELEWPKTFFDLIGKEYLSSDFVKGINGIIYECGRGDL